MANLTLLAAPCFFAQPGDEVAALSHIVWIKRSAICPQE
jgi:hypothetical protein